MKFGPRVPTALLTTPAEKLNRLALDTDPTAAMTDFVREYWPAVPCFALREEAELIVGAVEAAGEGTDVIWGLDYDVMGDRYALRRLLDLAPDPAARSKAGRVLAVADSMFGAAQAADDLAAVFMFAGSDTLLVRL